MEPTRSECDMDRIATFVRTPVNRRTPDLLVLDDHEA